MHILQVLMNRSTAHKKVVDEHLLTLDTRRASLLSEAMSASLRRGDKSVEVSEIICVGSSCDIELEEDKNANEQDNVQKMRSVKIPEPLSPLRFLSGRFLDSIAIALRDEGWLGLKRGIRQYGR